MLAQDKGRVLLPAIRLSACDRRAGLPPSCRPPKIPRIQRLATLARSC